MTALRDRFKSSDQSTSAARLHARRVLIRQALELRVEQTHVVPCVHSAIAAAVFAATPR